MPSLLNTLFIDLMEIVMTVHFLNPLPVEYLLILMATKYLIVRYKNFITPHVIMSWFFLSFCNVGILLLLFRKERRCFVEKK